MKNKIISFLIGAILFSGITAYAASVYYAKDISYTKTDGQEINVESALDELYEEQNKKISSIGNTYTNKYYNGTKNTTNEVSLEIEKGTYFCSATYGNAGEYGELNYFKTSGQNMTIVNCDTYNELYSYQNFQTASSKLHDIKSEVLVGKNFICTINENKSIKASVSSGEKSDYLPIAMEFSCTKLNME